MEPATLVSLSRTRSRTVGMDAEALLKQHGVAGLLSHIDKGADVTNIHLRITSYAAFIAATPAQQREAYDLGITRRAIHDLSDCGLHEYFGVTPHEVRQLESAIISALVHTFAQFHPVHHNPGVCNLVEDVFRTLFNAVADPYLLTDDHTVITNALRLTWISASLIASEAVLGDALGFIADALHRREINVHIFGMRAADALMDEAGVRLKNHPRCLPITIRLIGNMAMSRRMLAKTMQATDDDCDEWELLKEKLFSHAGRLNVI